MIIPSARTPTLPRRLVDIVLEMVPALCSREADRSAGLLSRRCRRPALVCEPGEACGTFAVCAAARGEAAELVWRGEQQRLWIASLPLLPLLGRWPSPLP